MGKLVEWVKLGLENDVQGGWVFNKMATKALFKAVNTPPRVRGLRFEFISSPEIIGFGSEFFAKFYSFPMKKVVDHKPFVILRGATVGIVNGVLVAEEENGAKMARLMDLAMRKGGDKKMNFLVRF